ncbi:hypothetical protein SERLA73DRAFT_137496 [Serpula lacrymans var. lacrymans S7.3]|uniref:Enoyl reductase (ER) domain-containing protein n=2 Tax=Serpula lacrymans var. lacrymans TaxID=341189 RepID=F8PWR6_SERL3|nr:uncharacterized protein SERLADRAFT_468668 [Serpula lacrymans var. lacrymans S7.9]EGN99243.1 hypothetical protein SERLA73DRAFT_137496 [Serpula lacrymans var. lacrymans S7.3]EGO24808.1 hypothetical protein SERLADRAFT_468668 [Serpula lacrymans var. lacrymans S7.9]
MSPQTYTQIVLRERPVGDILPDTFTIESKPFDAKLDPGSEQALVQITYLSLDPAMRGWLRDTRSYMPPVQIGEVMRAGGLGVVVKAGEGSKFSVGDLVSGTLGWTEYAVLPDKKLTKIIPPPGTTALDFLNTLGMPGMTAYFGLHDVGQIKAGETLVVSGAAGAVGSLTCQLGKAVGARVIAIAGSTEKCAWLEQELGVDKAINYKSPTFKEDFKNAVGYLDVFFDNVGGDILDFALTRLKKGARIALCGAISEYNSTKPKGLTSYLTLIAQRAKIQGFIVFDYESEYPRAIAEMAKALANGSIKRKFHIVEGLENAPKALPMLFSGGNTGKLVVKVSDAEHQAKL